MPSENVEIVRRLNELFKERDVEAELALMDADVELVEWPEGPDQKTYRGHAGVLQAAQSWDEAWEWLQTDEEEIIDAGDGRVLFCGRTRGKGKGSSVEVSTDTFNVYTLRDGKITKMEFFTTREPALRAAGLEESANVALVRRFVDQFNAGDLESTRPFYQPDVELHEWPDAPGAGTYHGIDGMLKAVDGWFEVWGSMQVEIEEIFEVGDQVLVFLHQRARGRESEVEVEVDSFNVYTFRDGKVSRIQLFIDRESALEAAGLIPEYEKERR
jgi:ketosteroid isomerase-like protein